MSTFFALKYTHVLIIITGVWMQKLFSCLHDNKSTNEKDRLKKKQQLQLKGEDTVQHILQYVIFPFAIAAQKHVR